MTIILKKEKTLTKELESNQAQDFIAAGVACFAFSLIDELGLVEQLFSGQGLSSDFFRSEISLIKAMTSSRPFACV